MKFHADKNDTKIAERDMTLDCSHTVQKGETFYVVYDYGQPVLQVCTACVITD